MKNYEQIKQLAKELNCTIRDLIVLDRNNDPYYAGVPAMRTVAEWFARYWREFGYTNESFIRRFHYRALGIPKPNGEPYQNTEHDAVWANLGSRQARYLGLLDPETFVDHRNPQPHIYLSHDYEEVITWRGDDVYIDDWDLPDIGLSPPAWLRNFELDWEMPSIYVQSYVYDNSLQPYHLEIWCEKSTMNDILVPLCEEYGVNLITSIGTQSITGVIKLLRARVGVIGKPTRIFYISDFDPAGDTMPTGVARQIEFWLEYYGMTDDIKLKPIVLTKQQVRNYKLPRMPIKEKETRKAKFEERYGEGATELDALEALYPGELANIITDAIEEFWDEDLKDKLDETNKEFEQQIEATFEEAIAGYREQLYEIRGEVQELANRYKIEAEALIDALEAINSPYIAELDALSDTMNTELAPYKERLEGVQRDAYQAIAKISMTVDLPELEYTDENDDWLFDSERDYFDQLKIYKAWKKG